MCLWVPQSTTHPTKAPKDSAREAKTASGVGPVSRPLISTAARSTTPIQPSTTTKAPLSTAHEVRGPVGVATERDIQQTHRQRHGPSVCVDCASVEALRGPGNAVGLQGTLSMPVCPCQSTTLSVRLSPSPSTSAHLNLNPPPISLPSPPSASLSMPPKPATPTCNPTSKQLSSKCDACDSGKRGKKVRGILGSIGLFLMRTGAKGC